MKNAVKKSAKAVKSAENPERLTQIAQLIKQHKSAQNAAQGAAQALTTNAPAASSGGVFSATASNVLQDLQQRLQQDNALRQRVEAVQPPAYDSLKNRPNFDRIVNDAMQQHQGGTIGNALSQFRLPIGASSRGFLSGLTGTPGLTNVTAENMAANLHQQDIHNPALWAAQNSEALLVADAKYSGTAAGMDEQTANYLYMNNDELQTYTYLLETQGRAAADEYYGTLQKELTQRRHDTRYAAQAQWAAEHPGAASVASFGTSMLQAPAYLTSAVEYGLTGDISLGSDNLSAPQLTAALREGSTSNIKNETAKWFANLGYSMGDSLFAILAGGSNGGAMALMGGEAAGAGLYNALRSGKTAEQALIDGGVSALIEAATERFSLGNLRALTSASGSLSKQGVKEFVKLLGKNMAKQGVAEMSEEVLSEYANTIYDILKYRENSEYNQYYISLLEQGISADEAEDATRFEFFVRRPGEAGAGGAISGMFFGGGGTFYGAHQMRGLRESAADASVANEQVRQVAAGALSLSQSEHAAADTIMGIAQRGQADASTIADTVAEKVLTGQTPTNSEIRQLQNATTTIQRSFESMTGIEVVGVDSSNLRASISAAAKTPAITLEKAAEYIVAVEQMNAQQTAVLAEAPAMQSTGQRYGALAYNTPSASAVATIDAARQGGAPLEVATAQDEGSAADMAADFRQRQIEQRKPTEASAETDAQRAREYFRAIDAGDHVDARRMIRDAAKEAMPDTKILDSKGNPLVVYHGTNTGDFTVFDAKRIGESSGDMGFFGTGFYFARDLSVAEGYGEKRVIPAYLNITNPFNFGREMDTYNGAKPNPGRAQDVFRLLNLADKFPKIAAKTTINVTRNGSQTDEQISVAEFAKKIKGEFNRTGNILTALADIYSSADVPQLRDIILANNAEFTDELKSRGYDGVVQSDGGQEIVAFYPNQIKSAELETYDKGDIVPLSRRFNLESDDIRFRLTGNQYNAPALEYALEEGTFNEAQIANLTGQLRDKGIELPDDPTAGELLEAVDMLDNMEPGFVLNVTEKVYKTAEQKAAEKAAREKAATDRAERKRLAEEEKQRKAAEAEQERQRKAEEAERKKAAVAERRAKAEKSKATAAAARAERQTQSSITKAAKENIVSTERIKGDSKTGNSVQIVNVDGIIRSLDGNARAEFERATDAVSEFGKAFGHRVRFFTGRMSGINEDVSGIYHNGSVYVNVDNIREAGLKTVAHEVCHDIAAHEPGFVNSFYRLYRDYCESNGLMNEFNRRWNKIYNSDLYPQKQLALAEEVLAEKFGEFAENDSEFLGYCINKRPGVITRIVEAFNRILTKLHLKKYSKAAQDAMELRNYMLGVMAKYKMNQTGANSRLSSGIRANYAAAQRKAEAIGDRYTVRGDAGVNLTEWDTTGMAAPAEYKNLRRTAPDETTTYGFKQVAVNGRLRNVLIVNPFRYLSKGKHADMVASTRSLASALGLRIGFIAGQTSETTGEGNNRRDTVIDADFLLTNDDRVFINLDSEIPYTEIVAMAWWKQFRATNPRVAANMERLAERTNALTGDDRIAQDYVVDLLTRKGSPGIKALRMSPDRLVMALSDRKSAAYAYAHENPGIMRKLFENAGDMVARLAKKQDYRAAYISGQLQARLMKAFTESDPNRPGGGVIEDVKAKSLPDGVWFMSSHEMSRIALDYSDVAEQKSLTRELHAEMINRNVYVDITQDDLDALSQYYPDLRTVKRKERNAILKEKIHGLREYLSNELTAMLGDRSFEMRINGDTIDVRVYRTGIEHVLKNITQKKAAMLEKSDEVFSKAEYLFSLPHDPHGAKAVIEFWDYFYVPVKIYGDDNATVLGVRIAVRTVADVDAPAQIYDWNIKKETSLDHGVPAKKAVSSGVSSDVSEEIIPHPTDEVKSSARRDNNATPSEPTRKTTDPVDTYKRRDLRARISKEVKALSAALVTPSDKKHIPPKLTAAIADFLKEFTNDTSVFTAGKLAVLREAYDRLSDSGADADMDISYAYDPDISATISELSDTIDGRRLARLSLDETVKVKNIVQHFKHLVTAENAVFINGRREMVAGLGMSAMSELARRPAAKDAPSEMRAVQAFKDMLTSGNLTPVYFFKRIGGTIQRLFKTVLNAQNTWARNMQDARQVYESAFRKYHADRWMEKKGDTLSFQTERGDDITLTRQQALTLYATYKREETNQIQEAGHLRLGGFVYEDAVKTKRDKSSVDTSKAHPLSAGDMVKIIDWLTDEQIKFADELVGYMSGDLAKLGNETSMQLHGWEKFTESYYFPYNSAENYLYTKQAVTEDRRLKHMSFTKSTVRKANNPIVLSDFTQVWAGHVQNMLLYSSLVVPLENFNRVYNYKTSVTEDSTSRSVKEELERAYGKRANHYISQLLTDINGGVRPNPGETLVGAMLSKFKKSAVFASASVVVQQPSAIGRAMALIDPKYFVQSTFQRKNWEECKRYCGVALIKEMGRFDTGTGRGAAEWLIAQPYKGAQKAAAFITDSAYRDEVLSAPAAKADAYTWAAIWNACKREAVKEKGLKPGSDELFKAAAERFDEVVNFTQVYDSVFSRSELMRSKGVGAQMLTSFMGEPTVSYNMLYDAVVNAKRTDVENKVSVPRAAGAFLLTTALNAILKSLVTAARDDDEERTYIEKYLGELVENFTNDANVLNLVPYVRDVMSLVRGYSVENSAYEIPSMLIDAVDDLDNDKLTGKDKLRGIAEATAALFGVPLKNVLRDIDAAINTFFHTKPLEDTTGAGIINAVLDKLPGYDNARTANYGRLFDAYTSGDNERAEKILDRLDNAGADESDVLSGLRKEAKGRYLDGDITDAEAIQFLTEHGSLDENEAYWKLQEWTYEADNPGENFSKYNRLRNALDDEDYREAHDAAVELLEHGVAVRTLKSETSKHVGSSSILYRIGLADYLNADKGKSSGGSSGRSSGRSSGGSTAKAAAPESSSGTAFTSNDIDLPDFDASTTSTIPRSASQNRRVKAPARQNTGTTGGVTETTAPSSNVTGIYNTGCDNYDNGTCRIGRTSCDGCPFATNQ